MTVDDPRRPRVPQDSRIDNSPPATLQPATRRLVLASGSRVRADLLRAAGLIVEVRPSIVDEAPVKRQAIADGLSPAQTAIRLAELKAASVADPDALIIGADQILVCDGHWFDKPADLAAARTTLEALRGRVHSLQTAVVCMRQGRLVWRHLAEPSLRMRLVSDTFLDLYLALEGDSVLSSVGAYRLEALGVQLFDRIDGEHAAILGLPMLALLEFLRGQDMLLR